MWSAVGRETEGKEVGRADGAGQMGNVVSGSEERMRRGVGEKVERRKGEKRERESRLRGREGEQRAEEMLECYSKLVVLIILHRKVSLTS